MILVDTSVLIDFFQGKQNNPTEKFKTVLQHQVPFGITSFIFQEVLQGASSEKEYRLLKDYLESQRFYHPKDPVDSFAEAVKIFHTCRKKGIMVRSSVDCLVAQISMEHNLPLLHNDQDFELMKTIIPIKLY
jgi:predicted nucleic acid-binding protein